MTPRGARFPEIISVLHKPVITVEFYLEGHETKPER